VSKSGENVIIFWAERGAAVLISQRINGDVGLATDLPAHSCLSRDDKVSLLAMSLV
jgi:hypothetical protein